MAALKSKDIFAKAYAHFISVYKFNKSAILWLSAKTRL